MTAWRPLSEHADPLSAHDTEPDIIEVCNVRPAYEVSLAFGATEAEIEAHTGMTRAHLAQDGATVSGDATYAHMELMAGKPRFAEFLVAAARAHTLASLGVVGLACKTVATVGEALACHRRFGHLTNRTASYSSELVGDRLVLSERRRGPARPGNLLVSDYAMLIAVHVLRQSAPGVVVYAMDSRRERVSDDERRAFASLLGPGARLHTGAEHAALHLGAEVVAQPVASADPELARYFADVLARADAAAPPTGADDPLLLRVRAAIRDALVHGPPSAAVLARRLGLGQRTLQRRLHLLGTHYAAQLDATRRALAEGYLRDPSLSLAEIAYLLGYDEQPSFYRAFRRWHGATPGEWRRART